MDIQKPVNSLDVHKKFMRMAIDLAREADIDMPIAALIVKDGKIISSARNQKELTNDPTAHAEILAIREAGKLLQNWRLSDVTLYTTLEPCPMCAGAILFSRIPVIVFGAYDNIHGALGSIINIAEEFSFYTPQIIGGVEEESAKTLLNYFFR